MYIIFCFPLVIKMWYMIFDFFFYVSLCFHSHTILFWRKHVELLGLQKVHFYSPVFEISLQQDLTATCVKTHSFVYYLHCNKLQDVFLFRIFNTSQSFVLPLYTTNLNYLLNCCTSFCLCIRQHSATSCIVKLCEGNTITDNLKCIMLYSCSRQEEKGCIPCYIHA